MTSKQCNSCKYHIYVKELGETCFLINSQYFMKKKNCPNYKNGKLNEGHKEFFEKVGKQYPFTELRRYK